MSTDPQACPGCQHPQHGIGIECEHRVEHDGQRRWHLCLCLNRPGASRPCSPLMTCQGGTFGYGDIWYLQRGQRLQGANGEVIKPDVLLAAEAVPAAGGVVSAAPDQADDEAAEIERLRTENTRMRHELEVMYGGAFDSLHSAPPADRAAVYAEVAERLAADAEQGDKEGFTRIYRRSAAKQVREWGEELPAGPASQPPADRSAVLLEAAAALDGLTQETASADMTMPEGRWRAGLDAGVRELRRLAAEAQQQPETCGRTKSVAGTEYPPCARPVGHAEAYCRSADGKTHFLAVYGPRRPNTPAVSGPRAADDKQDGA